MKIILGALIAPDLDFDIVDLWIDHYKKLELDEYRITIHKEMCVEHSEVVYKLQSNGFKVYYISGTFRDGQLRASAFKQMLKDVDPEDYVLSVDSDEFQQWGEHANVREILLNGEIDAIEGEMVDCYGDELIEAVPDIPLEIQYPHKARNLETAIHPDGPIQMPKKICVAKHKMSVCYIGSHDITTKFLPEGLTGQFRVRGIMPVYHFKWRASAAKRLATKQYVSETHVKNILEAFKKVEEYNV